MSLTDGCGSGDPGHVDLTSRSARLARRRKDEWCDWRMYQEGEGNEISRKFDAV